MADGRPVAPIVRLLALIGVALALAPARARAWGPEGHQVVAVIARSYLTDPVRAKVDAILAGDPDTLTGRDMIARANWADAWRDAAGHRETAPWHFVDIELDHPDLGAACFDYPNPPGPASAGPARDCVVDKVDAFAAELGDPATAPEERLLALKYLLHFVGDMHQPLHASDNHDKGGNCVHVTVNGAPPINLHRYWDTDVVEEQDPDPLRLADRLRARIAPQDRRNWERGTPRDWAMEAFAVARQTAYTIDSLPGCDASTSAPIPLSPAYDAAARGAAALQLQRAGIRLAFLLNRALARVQLTGN